MLVFYDLEMRQSMARFILALAAILLLAFSAGLTHRQLRQLPFDAHPVGNVAPEHAGTSVLPTKMMLNADTAPIVAPLTTITGEETPAPALLVYLVLILAGSAVAVGRVRHSQRREI
jgi:hypothetical protein